MLKLVAEGYAAKCIWNHNPDLEDTGENLFAGTGPLDLREALEKWFLGEWDEDTHEKINENLWTCYFYIIWWHYTLHYLTTLHSTFDYIAYYIIWHMSIWHCVSFFTPFCNNDHMNLTHCKLHFLTMLDICSLFDCSTYYSATTVLPSLAHELMKSVLMKYQTAS